MLCELVYSKLRNKEISQSYTFLFLYNIIKQYQTCIKYL